MSNAKIKISLDGYLEAQIDGRWPIAFENISFDGTGSDFVEVDFLPADTEDFALQGTAGIYRGVYQVTVVTPIGVGSQRGFNIAAQIADMFKNNTPIAVYDNSGIVYVEGFPSVYDGFRDDTGYRIPVSIPYIMCV